MFDLNKRISDWKQSLSCHESFTKENIDELESHLNDQLTSLTESGLSSEEAFYVAMKRIGSIETLNAEFQKVNYRDILRKRIFWMIFGVILLSILNQVVYTLNSSSYLIGMMLNINLVTWTYLAYGLQFAGYTVMFVVLFWIFSERKYRRFEDLISSLSKRTSTFRIKIFTAFVLLLNMFFFLMLKYGLQWINMWQRGYSESLVYHEYLDLMRFFNLTSFTLTSLAGIVFFYYAYRRTYSKSLVNE